MQHRAPSQTISARIEHVKSTRTMRLGLSGAARKAGAARGAQCALATEAFNRAHEMATILMDSVWTMMLLVSDATWNGRCILPDSTAFCRSSSNLASIVRR